MNSFFFICPECCIESQLRYHFSEQAYFATSLGAMFNDQEHDYWQSVEQLVNDNGIKNIYFVSDINCKVISNVLKMNITDKIYKKFKHLILERENTSQLDLCKSVISESAKILISKSQLVRYLLIDKKIKIHGIVNNKTNSSMKYVNLNEPLNTIICNHI